MKKVLKILTLVMLIITIIKIGDTYSRYYTSANTSNLAKDIGEWIIKVNEMDIYSEDGNEVQFTLNNFSNFTNQYTDPTKISPANTGYTEIVIDPEGTDVAIKYDILINSASISDLGVGVEVWLEIQNPTENMEFVQINENTYSGTISLADIQANEKSIIRCYIGWANDENKNEQDTEIGESTDRLTIEVPFTVTVTQDIGEVQE